jgi:hypothetical protein
MRGNRTTIKNLEEPDRDKDFYFDFSFWSHDGFIERPDGFVISFIFFSLSTYPFSHYFK